MAAHTGTRPIKDGLIFHYDIAENGKSWKGKPTTNIAALEAIVGHQGITVTYVTTEGGWKKYSLSGTWSAGSYPYCMAIKPTEITPELPFSTQITIKTNVLDKFNTFGRVNYVNDPNMINVGVPTETMIGLDRDGNEIFHCKREGFIYSSTVGNTSQNGYLYSTPKDGTVFDPQTDFVWIRDIQIEQSDKCSIYTQTSRSSSQSLLDVSRSNTVIDIISATYDEEGLPFLGKNEDYFLTDRKDIPPNATYSMWVKRHYSNGSNNMMMGNYLPYFNIKSDGRLHFSSDISGQKNLYSDFGRIVDNVWYHFTFVHRFDGTNTEATAYINGEREMSGLFVGSQNPGSTTRTFIIGSWRSDSPTSYPFIGEIPCVTIHDIALSDEQIKQNFEAQRTRFGV